MGGEHAGAGANRLPVGTVTFLRSDVEGSMGLARSLGPRWDEVNAAHLDIVRRAVDARGGVGVRTEGDAFFGAFQEAGAAVQAAVDAQKAIAAHDWPDGAIVRIRIGLHTGEAHRAGDDYGGFEVNRAARIAAAGHGGQVILSEPTRLLSGPALVDGISVRDLGRHVLRDVPAPERLFQLAIPGLQVDFPPLRTGRPSRGNLPERMTSFLGRARALEDLTALLETNRLVTLTGPGGIGKTSLAAELGREWQDRVPDGVWFVGLEAMSDPTMLRAQIARSLGLFDGPDRPAAAGLQPFLADRSALLLLDNFEHVLDAAAEVSAILRESPGTRIVVTSRAPLRIQGEQDYPVPTLAEGDAGVDLFVERARAARPGWAAGPDRSIVAEICAMLDGLPLGIELAAARVSVLPLPAIRDRLAARLPLPGSGPRDVPERQRTLEAAIAWSHDLLDEAGQRLLHGLGVFEGGFDVDQVAGVCDGDVLAGLADLAERSLVVVDREANDTVRFRLLQTIRSFVLERLAEDGHEPELRRRHAEAFLALARDAAPFLPGLDQARWLDRLARDHANFRAAVTWAIGAGETMLALDLVGALWRFWQLDGHLTEGGRLVSAALALPGAERLTNARLEAVVAAGGIAYWSGNVAEASRLYEIDLSLAIELGDRAAEADAHFNLMFTRNMGDRSDMSWEEAEQAIQLFEELGDRRGLVRTEWTRGTLMLNRGDPQAAMEVFEQAIPAFERERDVVYHAMAVGSMSWCYFALNQPERAVPWAVQSLLEYHAIRDVATTTVSLAMAGRVALAAGSPEDGAALLGAYDTFSEIYGVRPPAGLLHQMRSAGVVEQIRDALDPETFAAATARGRRFSLDEAVALVVELAGRVKSRQEAEGIEPSQAGPT